MSLMSGYFSTFCWSEFLSKCRTSRKLVLFIVFVALFLDNMLLTVVVPIIPNFLFQLEHPNDTGRDRDGVEIHHKNITIQRRHNLTCMYTHHNDVKWDDSIFSKQVLTHYIKPYGRELEYRCTNGSESIPEYYYQHYNNITMGVNETVRTIIRSTRHHDIIQETGAVGLMFASKSIMQMIINPFIGPLTNRIGYSIPMFAGFVIMFLSTVIFAFGETYTVLLVARTVQGIGSACSSVSGMGMLADRYPDDRERGNAMGIALGGLALGVLVGPPFGGILYQFVGKELPFLLLACLAVLDGVLQMLVLQPGVHPEDQVGTPIFKLLRDPYILIAAGSITFANMGIAMLEPSLPLWMMDKMDSPKWQQGAAFLPASISYLIGTNVFGPLAHKFGRWLSAMVGMVIVAICLFAIPFCTNYYAILVPNAGWGFAIGMVDSSMMPIMGWLVDHRHVSVYGSVYAIADIAFCMGFAVGPAITGSVVQKIGFKGMLWSIAIVNLIYAPLLIFLQNPPGKEEKQSLIMQDKAPVQYITYNGKAKNKADEDDPEYFEHDSDDYDY